jgi:DNA-binding CsgD family transcriptional regulator
MDNTVRQPRHSEMNAATTRPLANHGLESTLGDGTAKEYVVDLSGPVEITDLSLLFQEIRNSVQHLRSILPRYALPIADHIQGQLEHGIELTTLSGVDVLELYREERIYSAQLARCYPTLTRRELQICSLIHLGFSTKEIAERIHTSIRNVEHHRYRIRKKLHLPSSVNLGTLLTAL